MGDFRAKRIVNKVTFRVKAPPAQVFPLLCPVREYDWIDGWDCTMIYTESGIAEKDCLFQTVLDGHEPVIWIVSRYEPNNFLIEFINICPNLYVEKLKISLEDYGEGDNFLIISRLPNSSNVQYCSEMIYREG